MTAPSPARVLIGQNIALPARQARKASGSPRALSHETRQLFL